MNPCSWNSLRVCNDYRAPQLPSKIGFTLTREIYPKTRQGFEAPNEKREQQDRESGMNFQLTCCILKDLATSFYTF